MSEIIINIGIGKEEIPMNIGMGKGAIYIKAFDFVPVEFERTVRLAYKKTWYGKTKRWIEEKDETGNWVRVK